MVEKFQAMGLALKSQFLEREDVIDGMLVAALAGEHVLLVGPPGSAKSALVVAFSKAVAGTKYFEWLLGRFTVPEELFGPMSLKGLENEEYRRVTTGKLPEADVAFLDEVFKAGGAILNTLLSVLNERKFYNNGAPVSVPLRMVVGASNELPDGAELGALYDRFVVRYWIDYLGSADNFVRMVQGIPKGHEAGVTLTEWDTARDEVATIKVGEDIARELHKLRAKLASDHSIVYGGEAEEPEASPAARDGQLLQRRRHQLCATAGASTHDHHQRQTERRRVRASRCDADHGRSSELGHVGC